MEISLIHSASGGLDADVIIPGSPGCLNHGCPL